MFLRILKQWLKLNLYLVYFALLYFFWPLALMLAGLYLIGYVADKAITKENYP